MATLRKALPLLLSVALFLGLVEASVRALAVAPRIQIVRRAVIAWYDVEGVPQWHDPAPASAALARPDCATDDGAVQVLLAGSSVLRTGEYPLPTDGLVTDPAVGLRWMASNVALRLQDRLEAAEPARRWCVRNVAEPGYLPYQSLKAAQEADRANPADVVVLEMFKPDARYTRLGDDLYALDALALTPAGLPRPPLPLPDAVHRSLLARSAAWRLLTVAAAPEAERPPRPPETAYLDAVAWIAATGKGGVLLEVPVLDRPFAEASPPDFAPRVVPAARAAGLGVVDLTRALAGHAVEPLRLDLCCHFTAAGHDAVAATLVDAVRAAAHSKSSMPSSSPSPSR